MPSCLLHRVIWALNDVYRYVRRHGAKIERRAVASQLKEPSGRAENAVDIAVMARFA